VETDTPIALRLPGQEPYLHPLPVILHSPEGRAEQFYLHTSPEFGLKKLLAAGYSKNFSLVKCFRDYEAFGDGTHNTEFTMLEWYRAPGGYHDFMDDTEKLFKYVGEKMGIEKLKYNGKEIALDCHSEQSEESPRLEEPRDQGDPSLSLRMTSESWDRKTMKQVWQEYAGADLDRCLDRAGMGALAAEKGYVVGENDEYEDLFFKIFLNEIEPKLGLERPIFVYDFPRQMCSLSRVCPGDPRYAERAELYIAGLEVANGFGELIDATEQKERLEADRVLREKMGKPVWLVDPDFIAALASGMPEAGGIALGIDRMIVLFTGARSINEVLFQSVKDQLGSVN
jgi:lysyl-tRNA synthetase class 2